MSGTDLFSTVIDTVETSLPPLLDRSGLVERIPAGQTILIKPNLVEALAPPITTPAALVGCLIDYLAKNCPKTPVVIGEGCGSLEYDTHHCFHTLGYSTLASEKGITLIDLNEEKLSRKEDTACQRWPVMHLPALLDEVFLLSVPVLKVHTLAKVTLTMKNMMGCAPPAHFQGQGGWGKSAFHQGIQEAIFDLNRYRTPDFTLLDGSVGMAEAHLWGRHCNPPVNRLAACPDPVAIDAYGASLLGRDWRTVGHIHLADGILGNAKATLIPVP